MMNLIHFREYYLRSVLLFNRKRWENKNKTCKTQFIFQHTKIVRSMWIGCANDVWDEFYFIVLFLCPAAAAAAARSSLYWKVMFCIIESWRNCTIFVPIFVNLKYLFHSRELFRQDWKLYAIKICQEFIDYSHILAHIVHSFELYTC